MSHPGAPPPRLELPGQGLGKKSIELPDPRKLKVREKQPKSHGAPGRLCFAGSSGYSFHPPRAPGGRRYYYGTWDPGQKEDTGLKAVDLGSKPPPGTGPGVKDDFQ